MSDVPSVAFLRDPAAVDVALDPLRRRLLGMLTEPASATALAKELDLPRQRVNYHLRQLEAGGLIELDSTRPRRGVTERLYRRRAELVLVDPAIVDEERLDRRDRIGLLGVLGVATSLLEHGSIVAADAAGRRRRVATATLDGEIHLESPAAMRRLVDELGEVFARHDRPDAEGALAVRAVSILLPAVDGSRR